MEPNGNGRSGIERFRKVANRVLHMVSELQRCKGAVKESVQELSDHANNLTSVLQRLNHNVQKTEARRKLLHTSGVAATTLGSSLAAALWGIAYINEEEDGYCTPLAWIATGVGVGGTLLKMGTAYMCHKSNQSYMKELEELMTSRHGKILNEAESNLNSKFKEMIQLLKELYRGGEEDNVGYDRPPDHPLLQASDTGITKRPKSNASNTDSNTRKEEAPLVMTLMETADSASCAPDVISTVLDYSSDFGVESMEVLGQTYNAATSSIGEVISFGILEGAANGLSVVVSSYEIYRLINSWKKENPTVQRIEELLANVEKKHKAYRNLKKCIEIVDTFVKLRSNLPKRRQTSFQLNK